MMRKAGNHFESIESAHDFIGLFSETVTEVKKEVDAEILDSESARRVQALRTVSYNLEKLAVHMKKSCRILNDLRTLRRLLLEERTAAVASPSAAMANAGTPVTPELATVPNSVRFCPAPAVRPQDEVDYEL